METTATNIIHGLTLSSLIFIIGLLLKQHKVIIKAKERINKMWFDYCNSHSIPYDSIDNGTK